MVIDNLFTFNQIKDRKWTWIYFFCVCVIVFSYPSFYLLGYEVLEGHLEFNFNWRRHHRGVCHWPAVLPPFFFSLCGQLVVWVTAFYAASGGNGNTNFMATVGQIPQEPHIHITHGKFPDNLCVELPEMTASKSAAALL